MTTARNQEVATHDYRIEVPPFFCPVDPAEHPDTELVHRRSGDWARKVGIVRNDAELERWYAATAADFYGGMVPNGDTERYEIAANWTYWGFFFDDAHCDEPADKPSPERFAHVMIRILGILSTGDESHCGDDRHLLALCDLARSFHRLGTPIQVKRWIIAHQQWLSGVAEQNSHRAAGGPSGVDEYLRTRIYDCGGAPVSAQFEFVNAAEVPEAEMHSAPVRALTELFWLIACLDNERVSRHKEVLGHQDSYNLIDVLTRTESLNAQEAMTTAIAYRDRLMVLFLRLHDRHVRTASAPLRTYLDALLQAIRANIDWGLRTPRYRTLYAADGLTSIGSIELEGSCVGTPTDSRHEPVPVPAFAWWWTQL